MATATKPSNVKQKQPARTLFGEIPSTNDLGKLLFGPTQQVTPTDSA